MVPPLRQARSAARSVTLTTPLFQLRSVIQDQSLHILAVAYDVVASRHLTVIDQNRESQSPHKFHSTKGNASSVHVNHGGSYKAAANAHKPALIRVTLSSPEGPPESTQQSYHRVLPPRYRSTNELVRAYCLQNGRKPYGQARSL